MHKPDVLRFNQARLSVLLQFRKETPVQTGLVQGAVSSWAFCLECCSGAHSRAWLARSTSGCVSRARVLLIWLPFSCYVGLV